MIDISSILNQTGHRPWPLPEGPWIMEQGWYDLLFAHWPFPMSDVRALVPHELELDTFDGEAWVSITPFRVRMRPRWFTWLGKLWSFPELNCRTYVRFGGFAGIYFFSLDAGSFLAVSGAKKFYRLPYFPSNMDCRGVGSEIRFRTERRASVASFCSRYEPVSPIYHYAAAGSLEHWLTERYRLYTVSGAHVWCADIHHGPWRLQNVAAEILQNSIGSTAGLELSGPPSLVGYAKQQEVLVWPLRTA